MAFKFKLILIGASILLLGYGSYFNFEAGNTEGGKILFVAAALTGFFGFLYFWHIQYGIPAVKKTVTSIDKYGNFFLYPVVGLSFVWISWTEFLQFFALQVGIKILIAIVIFGIPFGVVWLIKKLFQ